MIRPRISIIIPVYNAASCLDKCVTSIRSQTFENYELLLVDDGSTDGSGVLCDKYAATDDRIKVFHQVNGGVSSARNLGIDKARGEWVTFVDSDDWLETDFLESLISYDDTLMVVGGLKRFGDREDEIIPDATTVYNVLQDINVLWAATIKKFIFWYVWGKFYKLDLLKEHNIRFLKGMKYSEDNCFVMEYMSHIDSFSYVACSGYCHLYERGRANKYSMAFDEFKRHFDLQERSFRLLESKTGAPFVEVRGSIYRRFFLCFLYYLASSDNYHDFSGQRSAFIEFDKEVSFIHNLIGSRKYKALLYLPPFIVYLMRNSIKRSIDEIF